METDSKNPRPKDSVRRLPFAFFPLPLPSRGSAAVPPTPSASGRRKERKKITDVTAQTGTSHPTSLHWSCQQDILSEQGDSFSIGMSVASETNSRAWNRTTNINPTIRLTVVTCSGDGVVFDARTTKIGGCARKRGLACPSFQLPAFLLQAGEHGNVAGRWKESVEDRLPIITWYLSSLALRLNITFPFLKPSFKFTL